MQEKYTRKVGKKSIQEKYTRKVSKKSTQEKQSKQEKPSKVKYKLDYRDISNE